MSATVDGENMHQVLRVLLGDYEERLKATRERAATADEKLFENCIRAATHLVDRINMIRRALGQAPVDVVEELTA